MAEPMGKHRSSKNSSSPAPLGLKVAIASPILVIAALILSRLSSGLPAAQVPGLLLLVILIPFLWMAASYCRRPAAMWRLMIRAGLLVATALLVALILSLSYSKTGAGRWSGQSRDFVHSPAFLLVMIFGGIPIIGFSIGCDRGGETGNAPQFFCVCLLSLYTFWEAFMISTSNTAGDAGLGVGIVMAIFLPAILLGPIAWRIGVATRSIRRSFNHGGTAKTSH